MSNLSQILTPNGIATAGANTFTAAQEWATGSNIASAATVNLNTATGNRVHITGTTAITAVTLTRGPRTVVFDGILTLTHHATNNNLPGAANITTAVGDRAIYESDGTTVYCVSYIKVNGAALVGAGLSVYAYDNRAALRTLSPTNGASVAVTGIGVFVWESASTEPDDDETAFATASGVWLLEAATWDFLYASQQVYENDRLVHDEEEPLRFATSFETSLTTAFPSKFAASYATKILTGSATCAITTVNGPYSASFTGTVTGAAVGDRVFATPPAELGSTLTDSGRLAYFARVSAANTVTVTLTNASAAAVTTNILIRAAWPITVIKT